MMLYLTGANSSLRKSEVAPQSDPMKSLGGFISSSPVPNGALNELFDLISTQTLNERPEETIALGLINRLDEPINNIRLSIVVEQNPICEWRVAATALNDNLQMESIPNRYSEPIAATFYDATFKRACVDFELRGEPQLGNQFLILPLSITIDIEENGVEAFWKGLKKSCKSSEQYYCSRLSERRFRISYTDEKVVPSEGIECRCIKDSSADIEFLTKFRNDATGNVILLSSAERLLPDQGIGLWFKRMISCDWNFPSDEELIGMKKRGEIFPKIEKAEIVITYDFEPLIKEGAFSSAFSSAFDYYKNLR